MAVLLVRVPFLASGAHRYDAFGMAEWTWELTDRGTFGFYAATLEVAPDHLPGDLWILFALGRGIHLFFPQFNFFDPAFADVLKSVAVLADVAIAILLFSIGRVVSSERVAVTVALGWAICPAAVIVSGIWGQWDALSMAWVLGAMLAVIRRRIVLAAVLLTIACLVKPQLALLAPVLVVYLIRVDNDSETSPIPAAVVWCRTTWRTILLAITGAAVTLLVLCLPFGVSLTGWFTTWSIVDRLDFALDRYQSTTLGAFNLWIVPIGRDEAPLDSMHVGLGLTYAEVGMVLVLTSALLAMAGAWRIPDALVAMGWATTVTMLGSFLFATRAHERYLFPAVVLAFVLVLARPSTWWVAATLSVTLFLSVWSSLAWEWVPGGVTLGLSRDLIVSSLAGVNLVVWAGLLVHGYRWARFPVRDSRPVSSPGTTPFGTRIIAD